VPLVLSLGEGDRVVVWSDGKPLWITARRLNPGRRPARVDLVFDGDRSDFTVSLQGKEPIKP
jgi:hypothetical protein